MSVYKYNLKGTSNSLPAFPGVYVLSGVTPNNFHSTYPIYKSIADFATYSTSFNDTADAMLLLPGFRCVIYQNSSYGTELEDFANTTSNIKVYDITNNNDASSIKVYFGYTNNWSEIT